MIAFIDRFAAGAISNAILATVAGILVWLITRFIRRPAFAHALWLLVLVKLIVPVGITLPVSLTVCNSPRVLDGSLHDDTHILLDTSEQLDSTSLASLGSLKPATVDPAADDAGLAGRAMDDDGLRPALAARLTSGCVWLKEFGYRLKTPLLLVWGCGTVLLLGVVIQRTRRFVRLVGRAKVANSALSAEVAELCRVARLRHAPRVLMLDAECSPLVWRGMRQTLMLLPSALLERLSPAERRMLLAHEIAHLERRDYLVRWLETIILSFYWWLPIAWLARRQLHVAAEECCDALVVSRFGQGRSAYAEALLKTLEFLSPGRPALPVGGSAFAQFHQLKRRFAMILHGKNSYHVGRWGTLVLVLCTAALLPVSLPLTRAAEAAEDLISKAAATASEDQVPFSQDVVDVPAAGEDVNRRLERLERMLESLAREMQLPTAAPPASLKAAREKTAPVTLPALGSPIPLDFGLKRLEDVMESITRQVELTETNKSRVQAASINLGAVEEAFRKGTVTLDLLLDAQRRAATSEIDYVDASLRLAGFMPQRERDQVHAFATFDVLTRARDKSLTTWRNVKKQYDANQIGADQEAQVREQYFLFRDQAERAAARLAEVNK